jgi:hypothetical protein
MARLRLSDGDLENLSHFIQAYYGCPAIAPLLVVRGRRCAAVLAQSGDGPWRCAVDGFRPR